MAVRRLLQRTCAASKHVLSAQTCSHRAYTACAFGKGWVGAAGMPLDSNLSIPAPIPLLQGVNVVSAHCGWGHSAFVDAHGVVTLLGRPHDFKNTLKHINTHRSFPALQRLMHYVTSKFFSNDAAPVQLAAADASDPYVRAVCGPGAITALLTRSGALFMTGQNFYGQCGHGRGEDDIVYDPVRVAGLPEGDPVTAVSCGFEHVLVCTRSGAAFSWGRGDRGQLGLGDKDAYQRAVRIVGPKHAFLDEGVVAVATCMSTSAAITTSGKAYLWGKLAGLQPKDAAAGSGSVMTDQLVPRALVFDEDAGGVVDVTAGPAHMSYRTADGRVWMTGLRGRGVTFDDTVTESVDVPLPDTYSQVQPWPLPDVAQWSLKAQHMRGLRSSTHFSYGLTASGEVLRWGWRGGATRIEMGPAHVVDMRFGLEHGVALIA